MAKIIVPFVEKNIQLPHNRTKFEQVGKPYFPHFKDANGVKINPSDISLVGQKFEISYAKGFFRAMDEVFEAKLTIVDITDTFWITLEDESKDFTYMMTLSELLPMMQTKTVMNGTVEGLFGFVAKGSAISLRSIG